MREPSPSLDSARTNSTVMLRVDALRLLVPHREVGAAVSLERSPVPTGVPGLFTDASDTKPRMIVAPSSHLRPLAAFPAGRFVLTPLTCRGRTIFFAWDEVRVLIDRQLTRDALPPVLTGPEVAVSGSTVLDGQLALYSTAAQISDRIFPAGPHHAG